MSKDAPPPYQNPSYPPNQPPPGYPAYPPNQQQGGYPAYPPNQQPPNQQPPNQQPAGYPAYPPNQMQAPPPQGPMVRNTVVVQQGGVGMGSCVQCGGATYETYSDCGIIWAICCFPWGLICLFSDKDRKCAVCGRKQN